MKFSQFKEEQKALGKVTGVFSFLAFVLAYKTKETLAIILLMLMGWIITILIDPSIAVLVKSKIVGLIK
jgi:hypothetical protein